MSNLALQNTAETFSPAVYPNMPHTEFSEDYLAQRFSRPAKQSQRVVYEVTRDPGLLHQYHLLCENLPEAGQGEVMVARMGNHCVAGCRLTFSNPGGRTALPLEKTGLALAELLPDAALDAAGYVEISHMAMLPDFDGSLIMLEFHRQLLKRAAEKKAQYVFTLAPLPLLRGYRKAAELFGLKWKMLGHVEVAEHDAYEGAQLALSMLDLAPVYRPKNKVAKAEDEQALASV